MKQQVKTIVIFLILNFAALAIGGFFTGDGVTSDWYDKLNKAPWTPPGWVFGAAWTTIMVLFSFFMNYLIRSKQSSSRIVALFSIQWILNVAWNPVFFYFQSMTLGLVIIIALTVLVAFLFRIGVKNIRWRSALILPYLIWLCIATSLNLYAVLYN
jgi:tryptophan-rich sensory protein